MGFENCHPAVNLIYFIAVIYGTIYFNHPVFLLISFLSAFAYSIKRNGRKAVIFNTLLLPFCVVFSLYYSSYTHFGVTVLKKNIIGNNITLESLIYGFVLGMIVECVIMWFSCVHSVFSSDKVVYLFGKISPRFSLFLAILLRMIPRIKNEYNQTNIAQCGIGKGISQGNCFFRIKNFFRVLSIIITWTIESSILISVSMKSRGSTLRGRKAFSIYRFDNRDRLYVIMMFLCLTVTMLGMMLNQTYIIYDPRIVIPQFTYLSLVFYIAYMILCIMPLCLELWTEYMFKKCRF